jgi:hypothetical protein
MYFWAILFRSVCVAYIAMAVLNFNQACSLATLGRRYEKIPMSQRQTLLKIYTAGRQR